MKNAQVLFPVNVPGPFDYRIPPEMTLKPGDFVYAPIGKQVKLGVVWALTADTSKYKLKDIIEVKSTPPLSKIMRDFVDWTARYNLASPGMALRMAVSSTAALEPSKLVTYYKPSGQKINKLTPARRAALDKGGPFPARASEIAARAGVSAAVVTGLASSGGLIKENRPVDAPFDQLDPDLKGKTLTPGQETSANILKSLIKTKGFNIALLDGVTGSGKTEVYYEAVAQALRQGGQVLILVPEIALTQAGVSRFAARFGAEPALWHSAASPAARRRVWREVAAGRAQAVIGARSALYLPFPDLRLIIVDEEHDGSYKQEEGVIYNARDMAVVRAKLSNASVVLASATPSLESLVNARKGRYTHIVLPERPGAAVLPDISLIDMRENRPGGGKFLSRPLIEAAKGVLERGEQVLLYLNRRGYAPLIICQSCGEKLKSPDTDGWLTEHRASGRAMCHLTGFSMPMPRLCPHCGEKDTLTSVGPGVERVAEEAAELFPGARIEILSSDTSGGPQQIRERMARMENGEIDILVGTQMVVKGHNFPKLTLVGVVDGDLGLAGGDLRAGERTYQTLVQVAGRAGRAAHKGRALIQSYQPGHEALAALEAGDREQFISAELAMRDMLGLPPFGRLAALIISGPDRDKTEALAQALRRAAPPLENVQILGPSEPPLARLRGAYRRRILVQAGLKTDLSAYMKYWRSQVKTPPKYQIKVDIDPQTFL